MIRKYPPQPQGLYHPANEHDACGVGFVANVKGKKELKISVLLWFFVTISYLVKQTQIIGERKKKWKPKIHMKV